MKRIRLSAALLTAAAMCSLLLPLPIQAEEATDTTAAETVQPYFTVTAAENSANGVVKLEDGSEWFKVSSIEFRRNYLIGFTDQNGTQQLLTVNDGVKSQCVWEYFINTIQTNVKPYLGMRAGRYHLVNDNGSLSTDASRFPEESILLMYQDSRLLISIKGTPSYLKYDENAETPLSFTLDQDEASLVSIYTSDENGEAMLEPCITSQPHADSYVLENSGYDAPTFSVEIKDAVTLDDIRWYADGTEQPCKKTSYTAEDFADLPAGVHRVSCLVEGHDADGFHYRETSATASFIITKGVLPDSFLTFSDIHEEFPLIGDAIENIIRKTDGYIPSLVICTGDYCMDQKPNYDTLFSNNAPKIKAALGGLDAVYVAGNHDSSAAASDLSVAADLGAAETLTEKGGLIFDGRSEAVAQNGKNSRSVQDLLVYGLNYEATILRSEAATTYSYENVLTDLEAFLQKTAEDYHGETIVISSHSGLHVIGKQEGSFSPATNQQIEEWYGDNAYNLDKGYDMVALLNRYAETYDMDILFLFGHNHSRMEQELFLTEGDTIISPKYFSDRSFGEQTLHFTYANAGYLSTMIGSADSRCSFFRRDGSTYYFDQIRTSDNSVRHNEIASKYQKEFASPEDMARMAKIDYEKKTGIAVYPETADNGNGTLTVILRDASGKVLDTYTLDTRTGIGTNAQGAEVNLPQTGNFTWSAVVTTGSAFVLIAAGLWLVLASRRKSHDPK